MTSSSQTLPDVGDGSRLYQQLARRLLADLAGGRYAVGDRLPPERELAIEHDVSRPTVREAIIALEVQGLVEVRVGSGAYVVRIPGADRQAAEAPRFSITAFELMEARLAIEGEAAALAALHARPDELDELDRLVEQIASENLRDGDAYAVDQQFHMLIAQATRNAALVDSVARLWEMRASAPESRLLLAKARAAKVTPVVEEHRVIAQAIRARDPATARAAMRGHLAAVIDHLLFATEEAAVEEARKAAQSTRARFAPGAD
ncbi:MULTISPECIES: FadR/GntR family transcriptional regulator [Sphingobium]|jgi:GntR family transcriptional repressor for pyruvate dehydrogenase complex|uniref:FadR family transcriptional regulator n=1 Tax=Sphingobium yanoikuyae TaxID=13690 RepID=A0A9X7U902_SPHYA|nr:MULTISPECIES: FadR/GntR family transcriptional regulator [Sphingobium]PZU65088.1 MAG: FadR family transcriptional regulator [Sphingobium sp.]QNG45485.1 FadR family transcriptional regulator [Sphingobium yanoikuyae]